MANNENFYYDEPGYYVDAVGERWLVGEDPDGDLVGINVNSPDPKVQYWSPEGQVIGPDANSIRQLISSRI